MGSCCENQNVRKMDYYPAIVSSVHEKTRDLEHFQLLQDSLQFLEAPWEKLR